MDRWTDDSEAAFSAYVESLAGVIGHADRREPLRDYCLGLLMRGGRKSVEPMAAVTDRARGLVAQPLTMFPHLHARGLGNWRRGHDKFPSVTSNLRWAAKFGWSLRPRYRYSSSLATS